MNNATVEKRIESVLSLISFYRDKLKNHPINRLIQEKALPKTIAEDFARIQFVDSILWVPMLSLAKGQVSSGRLRQAIVDNIRCEAGVSGKPHTTLCKEFVESLGQPVRYGDYTNYAPESAHPVGIMNCFAHLGDPEIAGWLLTAEALVPTLFENFLPVFEDLPSADTRYLTEHISVDSDEHVTWMKEAVYEIITTEGQLERVIHGVDLGGRVTLSIPDVLFAKAISLLR